MIKKHCYLIVVLLFFGCNDSQENKIDFSVIETTYNIKVHYKYSERFFPKSWLKPPICGYGAQIDSLKAVAYKGIIENCLSKYAVKFVKRNLKNIYLLKSMYFYNKNFGGTRSNAGVYVVSNGAPEWFLSRLIHSEFSSILLKNYASKFPFKKWNLLNDLNFKYSGTGVEVLGDKDGYCQDNELLSNGFLVKYAMSSQENDFNMFADWMITRPGEIKELCEKYPLINEKYKIVEKFYTEINSGVKFE